MKKITITEYNDKMSMIIKKSEKDNLSVPETLIQTLEEACKYDIKSRKKEKVYKKAAKRH